MTVTATLTPSPQVDPSGEAPAQSELSERDQAVLAFERQWWKYAGAKEQAVRELFDMSATRYYQVLNALIDDPAALAHDPMLVKRLRRMRSSRQRARTARRLGAEG
ncbi:DUF3263 domain-containing protein [Cellulomonas soli]|uniref:DUF3263 domain-containing protein n=1 Tax=Cellulomonas soli TaxID=931535 RepID=A0A512PES8_9CELL|nr:DUF3263 domain-containing protein [Cellulomonas soli]NYI59498.1 hypothetical protein [Cellulomonas soli]GEP69710.1 hypothetical protein CSO01_24250 [Cellulomonas soli]